MALSEETQPYVMLWSCNGRYTRQLYGTYLRQNGHPDLKVENCGLFISLDNPWLAGTPDGTSQPLGLVEIKKKNPYPARSPTLMDILFETKKYSSSSKLKQRHDYYYTAAHPN